MDAPKKPTARGLFWYVRFKGTALEGMTVQQISDESGTPVSSIYEHADAVGLVIERQKATVRLSRRDNAADAAAATPPNTRET